MLLILALGSSSQAADDSDPFMSAADEATTEASSLGPELGLTLGLSSPNGALERDEPLRSRVASVVPLHVDAGYRLSPYWLVGVYGEYGVGLSSATSRTDCPSCVHTWIRYGIRGQFSIARTKYTHAWIGLGTGPFSFDTVNEDNNIGQSYSGWELFNIQLGGAWRASSGLEVGPVFSFGYATVNERAATCYRINKDECPRTSPASLSEAGPIYWSMTGLRVVVLP